MITNLAQVRAAHARLLRGHDTAVADELDAAGDFAAQHARQHAKFRDRTGRLRDSTKHRVRMGRYRSRVRLRWRRRYALFVEAGTRPHVIRAKRKKYLRFVSRGRLVFAKQVNHPGTRPYKFGWKAAHAAHRVLGPRLRARMTQLARRF